MAQKSNTAAIEALAERVPQNILFGTSTWTYPGWKGSVYKRQYQSESAFKQNCLEEYCQYPLFRTVAIDSFFYRPPTKKTLETYAAMVPDSFVWVQKVWEHVTAPAFPRHARYGKFAGTKNNNFLNPAIFLDKVLSVHEDTAITKHTGPFVFQFPTIASSILPMQSFFEKLHLFLQQLPTTFRYAIEVRNPEFLCDDYFHLLNDCNATHCFNHWNYMPSLQQQMVAAASAGGLNAPFHLTRLLTPRNVSYQEAVSRFKPYEAVKQPNETMRVDVQKLIRRSIQKNVPAFVIVNNRSEGHAPGTIQALAEQLAATATENH